MTPNPLTDAVHFLVHPAWPTAIYWLLLIGSIAVALYAWRNIPSQRSWRNVGDWLCRFFIGTMWWQQTLWKLPPLYTDNPSDPLNSGLHYWMAREGQSAAIPLLGDFVIGTRTRGERESGSMNALQIAAGYGAGALTYLLYGVAYSDMCAFRAIRREALDELGMREMTYGWNLEMQMRAARAGLRILELPVAHRRRLGGESKVSGTVRGTAKAALRIALTFIRVAFEGRRRRRASEVRDRAAQEKS